MVVERAGENHRYCGRGGHTRHCLQRLLHRKIAESFLDTLILLLASSSLQNCLNKIIIISRCYDVPVIV